MKNLWVVCVATLVLATSVYGEPYKWVDKEGKVHYSDQKPESGEVQPDTEVENPDLDKGNFVSAEEAGLIVTEEEKQRRAEAAAKQKEEEERLRQEEMAAREAARKEAEAKAAAEAEQQDNNDDANNDDDNGYDYYDIHEDRPQAKQLPAERPRVPIKRPAPRKSP